MLQAFPEPRRGLVLASIPALFRIFVPRRIRPAERFMLCFFTSPFYFIAFWPR